MDGWVRQRRSPPCRILDVDVRMVKRHISYEDRLGQPALEALRCRVPVRERVVRWVGEDLINVRVTLGKHVFQEVLDGRVLGNVDADASSILLGDVWVEERHVAPEHGLWQSTLPPGQSRVPASGQRVFCRVAEHLHHIWVCWREHVLQEKLDVRVGCADRNSRCVLLVGVGVEEANGLDEGRLR